MFNNYSKEAKVNFFLFLILPYILLIKDVELFAHNKNLQYHAPNKTRPMRILFVVDRFPSQTKNIILNYITKLLDRGHDVYIYTNRKIVLDKYHPDILKYNLLDRFFVGNFESLSDLVPNLNTYDIVWAQYGYVGKKLVEIKKQSNLKVKLVTSFRGSDITSKKRANKEEYRELFKYGDLFLPVCEYFKYRLALLGSNSKKIKVLPSAIDCDKFIYKPRAIEPEEPVKLVSVCRLVEKKGINYAIEAVARLINKKNNIKYTIIGDGSKREALLQLIEMLGVEENIELVGELSQDEVIQKLDDAHIFILPSVTSASGIQEGIPNALKEAMACGIPVVSTYHAGIPELVENGVNGFLVPERCVSELAKKIKYLIDHPEIWPQMGLAGRKKVEEAYDKDKVNDRLEQIFQKIIK